MRRYGMKGRYNVQSDVSVKKEHVKVSNEGVRKRRKETEMGWEE